MRRTLRVLLALSSMLAFIGIMAPDASALHPLGLTTLHQLLPTNDLTPSKNIDGVCVVEGSVALHNVPVLLLGEHANHGLYQFTEVSINCIDLHNDAGDPNSLTGAYAVDAHGDSDGPDHTNADGTTLHGETAEGMGWSNNGHYLGINALCDSLTHLTSPDNGEGCGLITATRTLPAAPAVVSTSALNYVKFMRDGKIVNAWGLIDWNAATFLDVCFNALLTFLPLTFHTGDLGGNPFGYVLTAALTGIASLLLVTDHHCG